MKMEVNKQYSQYIYVLNFKKVKMQIKQNICAVYRESRVNG